MDLVIRNNGIKVTIDSCLVVNSLCMLNNESLGEFFLDFTWALTSQQSDLKTYIHDFVLELDETTEQYFKLVAKEIERQENE